MTLFKDKYRIESTRLDGFDYSQIGSYFVTIVTHGRECLFGDVADGKMVWNDVGKIVEQCWKEIPDHFPYASLDEFIVMPDHVHGIIVLGIDRDDVGFRRDTACRVSTTKTTTHQTQTVRFGRPTKQSIPTIVRSFKSAATRTINQYRNSPGQSVWQSRFYDHIVRNDDEFSRIREYVLYNPQNWKKDISYQ